MQAGKHADRQAGGLVELIPVLPLSGLALALGTFHLSLYASPERLRFLHHIVYVSPVSNCVEQLHK